MLVAWQKLFEGDLIAFSFAVQSKVGQFSRGNFTLTAEDASRYVRECYLQNAAYPLSLEERENLLMLAACAELEFAVSERGMPYPGQLGFGVANGLVWQSLHGRSGQYQRSRLHHPGMGKLLWQAARPTKAMLDYQCEFASRDPYDGFWLAIRYERVLGSSEAARRTLGAAITRAAAFELAIGNGMGLLKTQCGSLLRLATHADAAIVQDFLQRIATPTWLDQHYQALAPQQISVALYSLWIWTPCWERFKAISLQQRASRLVWNLHKMDDPGKASAAMELFGACVLFNVDVVHEKLTWTSQQQLDAIFKALNGKLGTEYLGAHQILFFVGLRCMARMRRDTLRIPPELGERILQLWRSNQSENVNHTALHSWMIAWLERCQLSNWALTRDTVPLPRPTH